MLELFPHCKTWVIWYLHPDCRKLIYPTLRGPIQPTACKDTNLQECLGGDTKTYIQDSILRCTIIQGVRAIALYQKSYFDDFEFFSQGGTLQYPISKPLVPTKYVNDGCAPDTEKAINAAEDKFSASVNVVGTLHFPGVENVKPLLSMGINTAKSRSSKARVSIKRQSRYNIQPRPLQPQKRIGHPPGKKNVVPTILATGNIQWDTFGIPW